MLSLAEALAMPSLWLRQWLQPTARCGREFEPRVCDATVRLFASGKALQVKLPVLLRSSLNEAAMAHTRNVIALEEGAELTLVELDDGTCAQRFANTVTAISLEPGARLRHIRVTANEGAEHRRSRRHDRSRARRGIRGIVASSGAALARQQLRRRA